MAGESSTWLDATQQQVWRRLLAVQCRLRERLDRDLQAAHGLSLGDYDVLVQLAEAPEGAMRMFELAERVFLSRSGLTRRVDGLCRLGLVARRACPGDGRGLLAELTPAGFDLLRTAAPIHVAGVRRYLVDPLGDLSGLISGLGRIEDALAGGST